MGSQELTLENFIGSILSSQKYQVYVIIWKDPSAISDDFKTQLLKSHHLSQKLIAF